MPISMILDMSESRNLLEKRTQSFEEGNISSLKPAGDKVLSVPPSFHAR